MQRKEREMIAAEEKMVGIPPVLEKRIGRGNFRPILFSSLPVVNFTEWGRLPAVSLNRT